MVLNFLYSLFVRFLLLLLAIVFAIPIGIFLLLPARIRYKSKCFFWIAQVFNNIALKCTLLPIKYVGLKNVPKKPVKSMNLILTNVQKFSNVQFVKCSTMKAWNKLKNRPIHE